MGDFDKYEEDDYKIYPVKKVELHEYQKKIIAEMNLMRENKVYFGMDKVEEIVKETPNNAEEYIRSLA